MALSFAAIANSSLLSVPAAVLSPDQIDSWGAAIVAPLNEEFYKGAGLVMIFFIARNEIDGLMDGLVYGAMIGLGLPGHGEHPVLHPRGGSVGRAGR